MFEVEEQLHLRLDSENRRGQLYSFVMVYW